MSSGEFLESARAAVESLADAGAAGELLIDAGTAGATLMTQCRGFLKFFNVTERLSGGEFNLSACGRSIPTFSGGKDYVPASDGRAARLATDGVDTEKLPALCVGGYVLTRFGEPKDVHLQYVYFSCVY